MRICESIHFRKKRFFGGERLAVTVIHPIRAETPILHIGHPDDNVPAASGIGHSHDVFDEFIKKAIPRRRALVIEIRGLTLVSEQFFDVDLVKHHVWSVRLRVRGVYPTHRLIPYAPSASAMAQA